MQNVREAFPDAFKYGFGNYDALIDTFGYQVIHDDHDDDYRGDSYYVLRDGDRYGYLSFGWGSCSGCDALRACNSYEELEELQHGLHESIQWFDSLDALKEYFRSKDWSLDYSWHRGAFKKFVKAVDNL